MKKTKQFKKGDKVFAKVKGYPAWPAEVIAENGKKYNVRFYGTGETGNIKVEDLFYYLKHKTQLIKPSKRKDYNDALEEIEKAITKDGGDGNNNPDDEQSDSNASVIDTSVSGPGGDKKKGKRKRTVSEKSNDSSAAQPPARKLSRSRISAESIEEKNGSMKIEEEEEPADKEPKVKKEPEKKKADPEKKKENTNETQENNADETNDDISEEEFKFVSEKALKYNIAYAEHITKIESSKEQQVEPREDFRNQTFPVFKPNGPVGGIKLHKTWPLKFKNEYDRALYDETVAKRVLEERDKLLSGEIKFEDDKDLYIEDVKSSEESIRQDLDMKEFKKKQDILNRIKVEARLVSLDSSIKCCLGLDNADPQQALTHLSEMLKIDFDELMLKKHSHIVEMVRRLRKYVGNTQEWNMSADKLGVFEKQAEKVRAKAEEVYNKFKKIVRLPEKSTSFWDGFTEVLHEFRTKCHDLTEAQIYSLYDEPQTRATFLYLLDEKDDNEGTKSNESSGEANKKETEKENSSEVANSETKKTESTVEQSAEVGSS